ncbi:MAG: ATP-binding protein [Gallionella sp.]|nr:ATP-binding protein [Gallionella sp.]
MDENLDSGGQKEHEPSLWYAHAMEELVEVVQLLSLARDLDTVMEIVRHAARKLTGADGATFVLRDNGKCFYAEEDAISPLWKGQRFPMSACISGWAMLNRQPAVIEDIYADPRIPADAYRPTFVRSLAMVPIRTLDPVGAIGNYWATQHLPSPEQVKVLQALADITAVTMENVQVYEELEQRVQQRTSELQSILDNVQVGIVFSVGGSIVRANPKSAEMFKYASPDAMIATTMQNLLRTADSGLSLIDVAKERLAEDEVFNVESRMLRQDGEEFWSHLIAKSLDSNSQSGSEIWVINDVSEAKAKEKFLNELKLAAEKANSAKDSFLATMSHEIRTPLTGMLGMLELLSLTELDNEQRDTLDAAWDSGRGLLRIVSDILDWSKIEEGKLELSPRPTSIQQMLQDVVNTYSRVASAKSLLLWQHTDVRLDAAYLVDSLRLSQVLNNFVSNAIKFTVYGEIELRAELLNHLEGGDRIRFSVKDTGKGISQNVQGRLFQRYRQESADTARMYGGTGLGLAICRRLAEMMDGQIALNSELGQGSIFSITLTLPSSGVPGEEVRNMHLEVRQRDVKPLLLDREDAPVVLAVDDHPTNRELLARQIRLLGLRAETAENGNVALSMWRDGNFAMVITDCHMPEMDGYALAQEIRQIEIAESRHRIPIIAWTANALAEEVGRCHGAGMDELLVKPADLMQLRKVLGKWLSIAETSEESVTQGDEEPGPIDYEMLNMIVMDKAVQIQVLKDFQSHIHADRANLIKMLEQNDHASLERVAHRMSGSCRMIGAKSLANACASIEHAARDGDMSGAREAQRGIDKLFDQLDAHLLEKDVAGRGE